MVVSFKIEAQKNIIESIWVGDDASNEEEHDFEGKKDVDGDGNKNATRFAQQVRATFGNNFDVTTNGDFVTINSKIYEHKSKINNKCWGDFSYIQKINKAPMEIRGATLMVQYSNKGRFVEEEIVNARHATCDLLNYKLQQLQSKSKLDALRNNNEYYLIKLPQLQFADDLLKSWNINTYGKKKIIKNITFKCGK
jgi:hypothetical protein